MIVYTTYIWLPLVSSLLLTSIAIYAGRFRHVPASLPFRTLMWLCALFSLIFALSLSITTPALRYFLVQLIYLPAAFIAPSILVMAITYTGHVPWVTRWRLTVLLLIPTITVVLALSYPLHTLFRYNPQIDTSNPLVSVTFSRGPWYWVYYGYGSMLTLGSLTLLVTSLRDHRLRRSNTLLLILGILAPVLADTLTVLRITPLPSYTWTPMLFVCIGGLYGWALLRGHIFAVVPIARGAVMDHIDDLVIVLDSQGRIADFNRATQAICGMSQQAIGATPDVLPAAWGDLFRRYGSTRTGKAEVVIGTGEGQRIYDLAISTIQNQLSQPLGQLFILHDMTARKQGEENLLQTNKRLEAQLAEIQQLQVQLHVQATHDMLSGLFNRRYMQDILDQSIAHATREISPVSVMMIDIDHFKQLNDTYGHRAGDLVLQAVGDLLRTCTRQMDTACRYGGEEFVVIMPGATLDSAQCRAEELRQMFANLRVPFGDHQLQATISVGVADFPSHGSDSDTLLRAADEALYMAKATGRNRVCAANEALEAASKLLTAP